MRYCEIITEAKPAKSKPAAYDVVHYNTPKEIGGKVLNSTVIYAASDAERLGKVKIWMDEIGLDQDDEDDWATITVTLAKAGR